MPTDQRLFAQIGPQRGVQPLRSPTVWALAVAAGVALQLAQAALWPATVYAAAMVLAAVAGAAGWALARQRRSKWHGALTLAMPLALAVLAFGWTGLQAHRQHSLRLSAALEGQDVQVVAVVDAMPTRTAQGLRLRLAVEQALHGTQAVQLPPLVEVTWYAPRPAGAAWGEGHPAVDEVGALPAVRAGERWRWTLRLKAPHGARNPHGMDWELWLWAQGIGATGYVRDGAQQAPPQRVAPAEHRRWVEQQRQRVRDAIVRQGQQQALVSVSLGAQPAGLGRHAVDRSVERAKDRATERAYGVVAALVTGDQRAIESADWEVFRRTGVAHLVSISGLHITMFAWLAVAVVGALWRCSARLCLWCPAPLVAWWAGVGLAAAYALFSGWGLPAQRTVGMLLVVALLRNGGWQWPWHAVWAVVLAVIAVWDPWALCQAGFWLSFVAVGVLLAAGGPLAPVPGWRARLQQLLREQLLVVLALSPLTLLFFGQISVVGGLANLLAIPWVTLLVTPLSLLGVVWPLLWEVAAWCVQAMVVVLEWAAAWPWASWYRAQAPWWAALAALAGGVALALPLPWQGKLLALPLLWPALWWQPPRPAPGEFDMLALDVGQGSAVLLRTAGHSLLFDAGPAWPGGDAGARVMQPLLQAYGERLDALVLSHGDADHVGGAQAVMAQQPQAQLRGAGAAPVAQRLQRPWVPCVAGQQWDWDGVRWQVLHPAAGAQGDGNSASCVLRVQSARGAAVLLTGDMEAPQEAALLRSGQALQADVLLAPHHGSRTSSTAAFIAAVAPRTAVVQAGYRNRFGHPAPVVLHRYAAQGTTVVSTPECGAVHWRSALPQQVACERTLHPRYWSYAPNR